MSRIVVLGCLVTLLAGCGTSPVAAQRAAATAVAAHAVATTPAPCVAKLAPGAQAGLTAALTAYFAPGTASDFRFVDAVTFSNGHMGVTGFCTVTTDGVAKQLILWTTYDPSTGQLDPQSTSTDSASDYGPCGD